MCSLVESEAIRPGLTPWLSSHYVKPNYRKQKVGGKLIDAIKRVAKNLNFERLYLFTFDSNLAQYYAHQGWTLIGKDAINNYPVSLMEIKLI